MESRKKTISYIINNFHSLRNLMAKKVMAKHQGRLTYAQQFALSAIAEGKDSGIKEVAMVLCTSSSATTQLVNALVDQGYVVRRENKRDRRQSGLSLTGKGSLQLAAFKKNQSSVILAAFASLDDKELGMFLSFQEKILSYIAKNHE